MDIWYQVYCIVEAGVAATECQKSHVRFKVHSHYKNGQDLLDIYGIMYTVYRRSKLQLH